MKKLLFLFAVTMTCLLSSCIDYASNKTMHVSVEDPIQVSYTLSYGGDDLSIEGQKKVKEHMLSIAERNLSADEAKKELQKIFTKELNRSPLSLDHVSRSAKNDVHSSYTVSYNWTFLQWCGYTIIAVILFRIVLGVILRNRRPKKLSNELAPGD